MAEEEALGDSILGFNTNDVKPYINWPPMKLAEYETSFDNETGKQ